jgi:hypothetical protein
MSTHTFWTAPSNDHHSVELKVSETKYISLFISISKTHLQDITEILRQDTNYDNSKLKL